MFISAQTHVAGIGGEKIYANTLVMGVSREMGG